MLRSLNIAQGAPVTSNGKTFDVSTLTVSIYRAGALQSTGVTTAWLDVGTANWAYTFQTPDGSCNVRTGGTALPSSAVLNAAGPFISGDQYPGCTPARLPTSLSLSLTPVASTWAYRVTNGIPFVCIESSIRGAVGGVQSESDCVEVVDANGTLGSRVRIVVTDLNGVTTTLTN